MDVLERDKEGYRKVILRSLTKVAEQAETLGNRAIRETYNISRADADRAINVRPASISKLQVNINVRGKRLPRIMFAPNQRLGRSRGVALSIKKGARKFSAHSFIAQMKSGHIGVFKRVPDKFMKKPAIFTGGGRISKAKAKQAIDETFTISVAEMFGSKNITTNIERFIEEKFPSILENQLQFYLSWGR